MHGHIDIVTVCFKAELKLLKLQARSMRLFMDPGILGTIHIIINDRRLKDVRDFIEAQVLPEYSALAARVKIHSYRDLTKSKLKKLGWRSQQALKLLISKHVKSPAYLILDSKNHFIRPVTQETLWHKDGRLNTATGSIHPSFLKDYLQARHYFGLPEAFQEQSGLPTVTPFPVVTKHVQEMIARLEDEQASRFIDLFMKGPRVTEFYLLYAFLEAAYGGIDQFYHAAPRISFSLMASARDTPSKVHAIIAKLERGDVYGFGVHRSVIGAGNTEILDVVARTWLRYGLIDTVADAQAFFDLQCLPRRRLFWFF